MLCALFLFCSLVSPGLSAPTVDGQVTRFTQPAGLVFLAHSDLDGRHFRQTEPGDVIYYDGGGGRFYRVTQIITARATEPRSTQTHLIINGADLSPADVQRLYFDNPDTLILFTCRTWGGDPAGGRLMVIAEAE